jgi:cytochrome-b5 reductase
MLWVGVPSLAAGAGAYYAYSGGSRSKTTKVTPEAYVPALDGEWRDFKVVKVAKLNHNVSSVTFSLPEGTTELGLPVASCLVTKFTKEGEKPVIRPYTPVEPQVTSNKEFDLVVKVCSPVII